MKICFAICEYNPFHNGHLRHIEYVKKNIDADILAIIMSGNFTERGEVAIMNKYTRAKHAIKAGADIVFELPTVFATAPAELFAKGGIKLANSFNCEKVLCFGTESGDKQTFLSTASALINETDEFKKLLKEQLKSGVTTVKAKINALSKMNLENTDFELLKSPNNILGIEYVKAILSEKSNMDIQPILRVGNGYNEEKLNENLPSALSIRTAIKENNLKKVKDKVPPYVYEDLPKTLPNCDDLIFYSIITKSASTIAQKQDCTEGLENRIKALAKDSESLDVLFEKLQTKRYTNARLRRIVLANMLNIDGDFIKSCLKNKLYLKVLAINKDKMEILSTLSKACKYPIITRKSDMTKLTKIAKECFLKEIECNDLYNLITHTKTNEYQMTMV